MFLSTSDLLLSLTKSNGASVVGVPNYNGGGAGRAVSLCDLKKAMEDVFSESYLDMV